MFAAYQCHRKLHCQSICSCQTSTCGTAHPCLASTRHMAPRCLMPNNIQVKMSNDLSSPRMAFDARAPSSALVPLKLVILRHLPSSKFWYSALVCRDLSDKSCLQFSKNLSDSLYAKFGGREVFNIVLVTKSMPFETKAQLMEPGMSAFKMLLQWCTMTGLQMRTHTIPLGLITPRGLS